MKVQARLINDRLSERDIAGDRDDRDAASRDRGLNGDLQHAWHLFGVRDKLAVMAALREDVLRMGLLKIPASDLLTRDLRGNGEYRHAAAMAVVKAVDQVHVAGAAATSTNSQPAGEMSFGASRESAGFFVSDVDPLDLVPLTNGIRDAIQGIACNAIDSLHAGCNQRVDE
jgi:hypothetical protein